jgi:hypothetical protein
MNEKMRVYAGMTAFCLVILCLIWFDGGATPNGIRNLAEGIGAIIVLRWLYLAGGQLYCGAGFVTLLVVAWLIS